MGSYPDTDIDPLTLWNHHCLYKFVKVLQKGIHHLYQFFFLQLLLVVFVNPKTTIENKNDYVREVK